MCKATTIDYLCYQIIEPSSGAYAHSIKGWKLQIYKLKTVAMVTGTLIGLSIGKKPKNIYILSYFQYNLQQRIKFCLGFSYFYLPIDAMKKIKLAGNHDLWM